MVIAGAFVPAVVLYLLILVIDPYDSVSFSPKWERYPVRGDHRHWNAMLVRKPGFDSTVIGTSSSMLLKPSELNEVFRGSFVNLSMPAATPFEQLRLLDLFQHYHPRIGTVVFGLDSLWCHPDGGRQFTNDILRRAFPEWLYDTVTWNDLPPFNKTTLKATYDQARALLGIFVPYQRWTDGYEDLTQTLHKNKDPEAIRKRIYEGTREGVLWRNPDHPPLPTYPDLDRLAHALGKLPATTLKVLFFSPYHHFHLPQPGTEQETLWEGCKNKATGLAERVGNLVVVDFLIRSPITNDDSHYIDGYHYTTAIASRVTRLLGEALEASPAPSDEFRILARNLNKLSQR